eukprot:1195414-Prorocentrum_minimum.AAC.4
MEWHVPSPGVDGQKGLRLQFNNRQSTLVYHSAHGISNIPPNIRHIFPADRLPLVGRQSTPGLVMSRPRFAFLDKQQHCPLGTTPPRKAFSV